MYHPVKTKIKKTCTDSYCVLYTCLWIYQLTPPQTIMPCRPTTCSESLHHSSPVLLLAELHVRQQPSILLGRKIRMLQNVFVRLLKHSSARVRRPPWHPRRHLSPVHHPVLGPQFQATARWL